MTILLKPRTLIAAICLIAGLPVVLLLTSAWWLPAALPSLAAVWGLEMREATRLDSGRLKLSEPAYVTDGVRIAAQSVEAPMPLTYLRERFSAGFSEASRVEIVAAELGIQARGASAEGKESRQAPSESLNALRDALRSATPWLPPVRIDRAVIGTGGDSKPWVVEQLSYRDRMLELGFERREGLPQAMLAAELPAEGVWSARVEIPEWGVEAQAELAEESPEGWRLSGELRRAQDRVRWEAELAPGKVLPASARLSSDGWTLPPEWLQPMEIEELTEPLRIEAMELSWDGSRYEGKLRLDGAARAEGDALPLEAELDFSGDLERLQLNRLSAESTWFGVELDAPVQVDLSDGSVEDEAELTFQADLSGQKWIEAAGRAEGRFKLRPARNAPFVLEFDIRAIGVTYEAFQIERILARGVYRDRQLQLSELVVRPTEDSDGVELEGSVDLAADQLDLRGLMKTEGSDWLNAWIGRPVFTGAQEASVRIGGPLARPEVEGELDLGLAPEGMVPFRLEGRFHLAGTDRGGFSGSAQASRGSLQVRFEASRSDSALQLRLHELVSHDSQRPVLTLAAPTSAYYDFGAPQSGLEQRLRIEPFELRGEGLYLRGVWNDGEGLRLVSENLSSRRLDRWLERELPEIHFERIDLSLREFRPWLGGRLTLRASHADAAAGRLAVAVEAAFGESGIDFKEMELALQEARLLEGSLGLPLRFRLPEGAQPFWQLPDTGALRGRLKGRATPAFSEWLERVAGIVLADAGIALELSGTMESPEGSLEASAASLDLSPLLPEGRLPALHDLSLRATATEERIELERLRLFINEGEVSGRFALPSGELAAWLRQPQTPWMEPLRSAEGELRLVNWSVEDWSEFLPGELRRSGWVDGRLQLERGLQWTGELEFQELAVRPTASLPSVDGIGGRLRLSDRVLSFADGRARIGGSPVRFDGRLEAADLSAPTWEFTVEGSNVPITRTTDMILRSDIDLRLSRDGGEQTPVLSGALDLRASTVLVEFDPLSPGVAGGPRRRPPFFSIGEQPFADWRFDLAIRGDEFLRVRSPYLRARLSADFHLGGSFERPRLIGEVRTAEAELRFPGAKMRLDSGEAYIEEGRSDSVQLNFTGVAKTASYVITMEVSHTLEDPHIRFQSTPQLTNAQIVRLLATGSTSSGGAGTVGLYLGKGLLGAGGMGEGFADKLTVDVGEDVSRKGKNTVGIRYNLSEDTYLKGEYDVYDAYNLDLIWSLFKK